MTVSGTDYVGVSGAVGTGVPFPATATCEGKCAIQGEAIDLPPSSNIELYVVGAHRVDTGDHVANYETSGGVNTKRAKYIPFPR